MTIFTTIAFGVCAYLSSEIGFNHQTMILIGNINQGVCEPFMFMPDSHGQRATINGHEVGADINDNGAKLFYDGKVFYFVKDSI